jgi:tRNA (adenine22-N1)-methyltransferase
MLEISNRLKMVADQVKYSNTIADIGTDHAYVPIYLCESNKIESAIACDVNKGPLEKAEANIKKYQLEKRITTSLGSGLEKIEPKQVDAIVVAGMGGKLIIDILNNKLETVQGLKQMVLQPQLDVDQVREYIHTIGFRIENEEMLIEDNKYYTIISVIPGTEKYNSKIEYMLGKILIERKDPVLKKYLKMSIDKYKKIINQLTNKNTVSSMQRKEILVEEIKALEEVYNCL